MKLITDIKEWKTLRAELKGSRLEGSLGLVMTMGNLHEGHASLLKRSKTENDLTVLSLFVNPTQFNETADYERYPRTLEADLALASALGVDYVLAPEASTLYPDNFSFQVSENQLSLPMEGQHRPGHFTGMLTIVLKWLLLVQPHRSYMGEKDYQQLQLVRALANAFLLEVEVIGCPIVREPSGLALSSRNRLLNEEEKILAEQFAALLENTQLPSEKIIEELETLGIQVDYIEDHKDRRFAAVKTGRIRLIDNRSLVPEEN